MQNIRYAEVLLILIISLTFTALAKSAVEVRAPDISAEPDATVTISISVSDVTGLDLIAVEITLTYDSNILTAQKAILANTLTEGWSSSTNVTDGEIVVWMASAEAASGRGRLVSIEFHVSSDAAGGQTSPLTLKKARFNEGDISTTSVNGVFTVESEGPDTTPPVWDTNVGVQSAIPADKRVTVSWNSATDAQSPPVKYNLYYSTSSPAIDGTKTPNVSSPHTVSGLTNGQEYHFSVRAEDSATPPNEDSNTVELTATPAGGVNIPDPNLKAAIRETINKPQGAITESELEGITEIEANNQDIAELRGLEYCANLQRLELRNNQITDISALAGASNLSYLALSGNQITDVSYLSGLTKLTYLSFFGSQISDISFLENLANLTELYLQDNQITNISALSQLTSLKWLWLKENQITSIQPLVDNPGIDSGDVVNLEGNPLSQESINSLIPALEERGVNLKYDRPTLDHLVFISAPVEAPAGFASGAITVETRDAGNSSIAVEENLTVSLESSSNTGTFSDSSNFPSTISQITIPKGSSSISFYYKDATIGSPTITATGTGVDPVTQEFPIIEAITSITVEGSPAKVGDTIKITAEAVSKATGGTAVFSIGSEIINQKMTETASYTGSYVVQPGDDVTDAKVTLTLNGVDYEVDDAVTIDTAAPEVVNRETPSRAKTGSSFTLSVISEANAEVTADVSEVDPNQTEPVTLVAGFPVPGGTPYTADVAVNTTETGTKTIRVFAADIADNQGELEHTVDIYLQVDHFAFTTSNKILGAGFASDAIEIAAKDENGMDASFSRDVKIRLTSSSDTGKFAEAADRFDEAVTEVILPAGESSVSFYYKDTATGTATITADSSHTRAVKQEITVIPALKDYNSETTAWTGQEFNISLLSLEGARVEADVSDLNAAQREPIILKAGKAVDEYINYTGSVEVAALERADVEVPVTASDSYGNSSELVLQINRRGETRFTIMLNPGVNLVHIPVADPRFKTVSRLYNYLVDEGVELQMLIFYHTDSGELHTYSRYSKEGSRVDIQLLPQTGLIALLKGTAEAKTVTFEGPAYEKTDLMLKREINIVGLPVDDPDIVTLSDFAQALGHNLKLLIALDERGEFVSSMEAPDMEVTGGDAFIALVKDDLALKLEGKPWANQGVLAEPAISVYRRNLRSTRLMVVQGRAVFEETSQTLCGIKVEVCNLSAEEKQTDVSGRLAGDGRYSVAFLNLKGAPVAKPGDVLRVSVEDSTGKFGAEPIQRRVTNDDINKGVITLDLPLFKIPEYSALLQNFPNPFNPETWIPYRLASPAHVNLNIYDSTGRLVKEINVGYRPAGDYTSPKRAIRWSGRNSEGEKVSSGTYFYQLQAGDFNSLGKMVLVN